MLYRNLRGGETLSHAIESYTTKVAWELADAFRPGNPKDTSVEDLKALFRKIM